MIFIILYYIILYNSYTMQTTERMQKLYEELLCLRSQLAHAQKAQRDIVQYIMSLHQCCNPNCTKTKKTLTFIDSISHNLAITRNLVVKNDECVNFIEPKDKQKKVTQKKVTQKKAEKVAQKKAEQKKVAQKKVAQKKVAPKKGIPNSPVEAKTTEAIPSNETLLAILKKKKVSELRQLCKDYKLHGFSKMTKKLELAQFIITKSDSETKRSIQ